MKMGAMHAIEISHADNGWPKAAWNILEFGKNLHKRYKSASVGTAAQACPERSRRGCPARLAEPSWSLNLKLQLHPIVRKPHILRQSSIGLLMRQIMTNMGKERPPRLQPLHRRQRMLHSGMRWMWLISQRVQEQHIQPLQLQQ